MGKYQIQLDDKDQDPTENDWPYLFIILVVVAVLAAIIVINI